MSVDYEDLPLQEVLDDLRNRLGINIMVYWPAIENAGITREDTITLRLKHVLARRVIGLALQSVSIPGGANLGYTVAADGVVEVNLQTERQRYKTYVYYIADLLERRNGGRAGGDISRANMNRR